MKSFCKVLLSAILLPALSYAQSHYKPGYVVTLKGDTLKGFIDYREWDFNPSVINLKINTADSKTQRFTPRDISVFNVDALCEYKRFAGKISMDNTEAGRINNGRDTSFKVDTVFLKVMQKGSRVFLYAYFDRYKKRFYISDGPDYIPNELIYRLYLNPDAEQGLSKTKVENTYKGQLFALAEKYGVLTDALQNDIQRAEYTATDLLAITAKINDLSKAEYEKKYSDRTKIGFFAGVGANFAMIKPFGQYKAFNGKSAASFLPSLTLGADFFSSPHTGKLVLRTELIISGSNYQSSYIYTGSPYVPVKYSYNQVWVAVAPQIVYNFYNTDDLKIHAGLGIALTFAKYFNANYDLNYANTQVSRAPLRSDFFNNSYYPLLFKAGVKIKKIDLFAGYFVNTTVSDDLYFRLHSSNIQVGIDYFFNK